MLRQAYLKRPIRLLSVLLSFLIVMSFNVMAFSAGSTENKPIKVLLNGKTLGFDVDPYIKNGRTLVPFRKIFEAFGMKVDWNETNRTVLATGDTAEIRLTIGSSIAYVNGSKKPLDVPAEITKSRTFVPLRFVSENLGGIVKWDGDSRTVTITKTNSGSDTVATPTSGNSSTTTPTPTPRKSIYALGETASYNNLSFSIDKADYDSSLNRISVRGKINTDKIALFLYMYNESGTRTFANPIILDKTGDMYDFCAYAFVSQSSGFNKVSNIEVKILDDDNEPFLIAEYILK